MRKHKVKFQYLSGVPVSLMRGKCIHCDENVAACCLCFEMKHLEDLHKLCDGTREDVCWPCYWEELEYEFK